MIFLILAIFILCLFGLKTAGAGGAYFEDYISRDRNLAVKGLFTLLIFVSHFSGYVQYSGAYDAAYKTFQGWMGQLVVAMFLFYSGYGMMESASRKGAAYIRTIPGHRVLKVLVHFDIAVLLFWLTQTLLGQSYDGRTIILSLLGWDAIGNSNWYIFDILWAYIITWLSFALLKDRRTAALIAVTVLSAAFALAMHAFKQSHWYDTFFCYAAGMWYSYYKTDVEKRITQGGYAYFRSFVLLAVFYLLCRRLHGAPEFAMLAAPAFSLLFTVGTMKVRVDNPVLRWYGDHLFEVYMLQRIPMIVFGKLGIFGNKYVYCAACFIAATALAWAFKKILTLFDRLTFDRPARV